MIRVRGAVVDGRWTLGESETCPQCISPPTGDKPFQWQFKLLLEDVSGECLPVIVADTEARELLELEPDKSRPNNVCADIVCTKTLTSLHN
jgi:hypothetical protein